METHQVVVDTLVELPLGGAALPQLLVVVFEALPVGAELLEAGLVDVLESVAQSVPIGPPFPNPKIPIHPRKKHRIGKGTYTLRAHRVTRRPSFRHSNSPLP